MPWKALSNDSSWGRQRLMCSLDALFSMTSIMSREVYIATGIWDRKNKSIANCVNDVLTFLQDLELAPGLSWEKRRHLLPIRCPDNVH